MAANFLAPTLNLTLGEQSYTLTPTLAAARMISAISGGLSGAYRKVAELDVDVVILVLRAGAGVHEKDAAFGHAFEAAFVTGLISFAAKAREYLDLLLNGGQPRAAENASEATAGEG